MKVYKQTGTANTTASPNRIISYLVIHYTAGVSCSKGSARSCASWFANPSAGGSADYIVDEGELVQYNPDPYNRYCWAVGGGKYNTKGGQLYGIAKNSNCISLEICSRNRTGKITYPNDPNYSFTDTVMVMAERATKYLMALYGIDGDHVIRHYDVNGKECPGIIGWNADSGSEEVWKQFHASVSGTSVPTKAEYTPKEWIAMIAPIAQDLNALYNVLPSILIAQSALETGWGLTDLTRKYNIVGMKADLINSTWREHSTWDGTTYTKVTPEYVNNKLIYKEDVFRVYHSFRECLEDYCNFLMYVRNDKGYKYRRIQTMADPAEVIHAIRIGTGTTSNPEGYCTDPTYETKILNIIKEYNLRQYDPFMNTPTDGEPGSGKRAVMYRVQVGAYKRKANASRRKNEVEEKSGFKCFAEHTDLWRIYCGSFEERKNAERRMKELNDKGINGMYIVTVTKAETQQS